MLRRIITEKWFEARAVIGIYPARANDQDQVEICLPKSNPDQAEQIVATFNFLRQQNVKAPGQPNFCLADYIKPQSAQNGEHTDYLGAFAVTAGIGIEKWVEHFEQQNDDYSAILLKALADRLAEALAERIHERVRRYWGYAASEKLDNNDLIAEAYTGIRPAPGYPAYPSAPKTRNLGLVESRGKHRHGIDRQLRHVSRCIGIRVLFQPPGS